MHKYPQHVAIIMDGNGRWAQKQNLPRTAGHYQGAENIKDIALFANGLGIKVLTLYAFSTENWSRPKDEVNYLMQLPGIFFKKFLKILMENNIKVESIGEMDSFPAPTRRVMLDAIEKTKGNTGLILNLAVNYGSRHEIVLATQKIATLVSKGLDLNDIDENLIEENLMTSHYPPVDYLVRTSGECRLSNFLLWQVAYAEMYFVETAWPDFSCDEFEKALNVFETRNRRFGGI